MAKGDTFDVKGLDEFELTFQLNLKRAELAKRNDADKLTHVTIDFPVEPGPSGSPPNGKVTITALSAGADPSGVNEVLPITTDDPKFTRLYRAGLATDFDGNPVNEITVRARAKLCPKEGLVTGAGILPNDPDLCKIRIRRPTAPAPPTR